MREGTLFPFSPKPNADHAPWLGSKDLMQKPLNTKSNCQHGEQSGFSVIELIVVVAITLVLAALTGKSMVSAVQNYRLSSAAQGLAATVHLAKMKATARDARYQVLVNTGVGTYRIQRCLRPPPGSATPCTWQLDPGSDDIPLPPGVSFIAAAVAPPPPGQSGGPDTDMTFNSRGLLVVNTNAPTAATVNTRCFYVQGQSDRIYAVCSSLAGKTTVYRQLGSAWEVQ